MKGNPLVPRHVNLQPHVDEIVEEIAKKEFNGEMSATLRQLIYEALVHRGAIKE